MGKSGPKKRQRDGEDPPNTAVAAVTTPDGGQDGGVSEDRPPPKKARVDSSRSLFVRSLPPSATDQSLAEFFSQHFPVKHAMVVLDPKTKTSRGYGFVTLTDEDDVAEAREKLNNGLFDGRRLRLEIAEPRHRGAARGGSVSTAGVAEGGAVVKGAAAAAAAEEKKRKREEALAEARKAPKLIVRNLPWSVKTADQLGALFRSYGKVKFADLPKAKGKLSGFGFVTIRGRKNAEKAMEGVNGKAIDGRTLAVDWAVDKETWKREQGETETAEKAGEGDAPSKKSDKKDAKDSAENKTVSEEDADLANFMKNHMENLEEEDEDEEEKEENSEFEDLDEESDASNTKEKTAKKDPQTDNATTIFIRNLPFTTTDEQLKTHFSQFGAVRYARTVMDRATERPAGTGFVCFFDSDVCRGCLRSAPRHRPAAAAALGKASVLQDETVDQDGRYTMEGRVLQVAQAVSKEEAGKLAEEGSGARRAAGQDKDKRRLYLLSEGTIARGSALYKLLAPSEIKLRQASEAQRKKLVQSNPGLHLSLTRLAVRNIPKNVTSKDLKALARQAVVGFASDAREGSRQPLSKEEMSRGGQQDRDAEHHRREKGKGVVRQAKVVFESKEGSKIGDEAVGRSRGYGFIEFWSHRYALMGLRWLNGHPLTNEAGKTLRLVVEFAIENAQVVQRRKAMEERTRNRGKAAADERGGSNGGVLGKGWGRDGKGKDGKGRDRKGRGGKGGNVKEENGRDKNKGEKSKKDAEAAAEDPGDTKLQLRTKIIARKRMMRKKKATLRQGK